jgi:hypothetical protein
MLPKNDLLTSLTRRAIDEAEMALYSLEYANVLPDNCSCGSCVN